MCIYNIARPPKKWCEATFKNVFVSSLLSYHQWWPGAWIHPGRFVSLWPCALMTNGWTNLDLFVCFCVFVCLLFCVVVCFCVCLFVPSFVCLFAWSRLFIYLYLCLCCFVMCCFVLCLCLLFVSGRRCCCHCCCSCFCCRCCCCCCTRRQNQKWWTLLAVFLTYAICMVKNPSNARYWDLGTAFYFGICVLELMLIRFGTLIYHSPAMGDHAPCITSSRNPSLYPLRGDWLQGYMDCKSQTEFGMQLVSRTSNPSPQMWKKRRPRTHATNWDDEFLSDQNEIKLCAASTR